MWISEFLCTNKIFILKYDMAFKGFKLVGSSSHAQLSFAWKNTQHKSDFCHLNFLFFVLSLSVSRVGFECTFISRCFRFQLYYLHLSPAIIHLSGWLKINQRETLFHSIKESSVYLIQVMKWYKLCYLTINYSICLCKWCMKFCYQEKGMVCYSLRR